MNTVIVVIIGLIWGVRIFANLLTYIHLWWVKEYRGDRMRIHFKTDQAKRILWPPFRKPPLTPKTVALFFVGSTIILFLIAFLPFHWFIVLLLVDLLTFPLTWVLVVILSVPTALYHRIKIGQAMGKLRQHAPLKVIGITGSFGKTSTKEFLSTMLSSKYKVLKTRDSKNSPIGIAELILQELTAEHEVFVVEMGAYKLGEIARMCQMVMPQVGILTAINPQHQDLFKTIETTKQAKYELIQSLGPNGVALFNADNEGAYELAKRAHQEGQTVWLYTIKNNKSPSWATVISAEDVKVGTEDIAFTVRFGMQKINAVVSLLGLHQLQNILGALSAGLITGMTLKEAVQSLEEIRPIPKVLEPVKGTNGAHFVNDTFNNNPDAAKAAIDYLSLTEGKKILVFQPMIELGTYATSAHQEIGAYAARVCDEILLTNSNWYPEFQKGVESVHEDKKAKVVTIGQGARLIAQNVGRNDTVVFKGKEAEQILKALLK